MKRQDAPGELELVRAFLNTLDLEHEQDALVDPAGAAGALCLPGREPVRRVTRTELDDARALRAALREVIATPSGPEGVSDLRELTDRLEVRLVWSAEGLRLRSTAASPTRRALGELLVLCHRAMIDGTWARMRICPAADCRWAFYDHSRNRSGRWCQMAECGNRAKVRAHRARSTE